MCGADLAVHAARRRGGRGWWLVALALGTACSAERGAIWPAPSAAAVDTAAPFRPPAVVPVAPAAPPRPAVPPPYMGPSGEAIDDLCSAYATSKAEVEFRRHRHADVQRCRRFLRARSPAERQAIADCANLCNESGGYVECFDAFGTAQFPACAPGDLDDGSE